MIYAVSKRIKVDSIHLFHWKIIFSFLDNVNSVKEVNRKFFEFLVRKGITSIKVLKEHSTTRFFASKLCKMLKMRMGRVQVLDLSEYTTVNASTINRILQLKAFRQLKHLILGDCVNVNACFLNIPKGIQISATIKNLRVMFLNMKRGMSTFKDRFSVFFHSLDPTNGNGLDFFIEVCTFLNVQVKNIGDYDVPDYTEIYNSLSPILLLLVSFDEFSASIHVGRNGLIKVREEEQEEEVKTFWLECIVL